MIFLCLGVFCLGLAGYAIATGRVWAKGGLLGRVVRREDQPLAFWFQTVVYLVLAGLSLVAALR
ncbi:MAG TPA: hypothetical protein DEA08_15495 [Planctomycetes bacterium]|nr:hypothetical protein [Planctomycetota bacterium]